nr:MAG TPA: hypothetical protein [Caudoviricetes sp.]
MITLKSHCKDKGSILKITNYFREKFTFSVYFHLQSSEIADVRLYNTISHQSKFY